MSIKFKVEKIAVNGYPRTLRTIKPFHVDGKYVVITKISGQPWHEIEQWLIENKCAQTNKCVKFPDFQRGFRFRNQQIKMLFMLRWSE